MYQIGSSSADARVESSSGSSLSSAQFSQNDRLESHGVVVLPQEHHQLMSVDEISALGDKLLSDDARSSSLFTKSSRYRGPGDEWKLKIKRMLDDGRLQHQGEESPLSQELISLSVSESIRSYFASIVSAPLEKCELIRAQVNWLSSTVENSRYKDFIGAHTHIDEEGLEKVRYNRIYNAVLCLREPSSGLVTQCHEPMQVGHWGRIDQDKGVGGLYYIKRFDDESLVATRSARTMLNNVQLQPTPEEVIPLPQGSLLISDLRHGGGFHGVTQVNHGDRLTLVWFFGIKD